ncbi:UNKNOWN [Stylonychia lemnae]|uniref:Uncharacterized protein n=1 Tax=Stylonychia lemnae TaxID=5949 RepID=A0A078A1Z4_STYLE|nr:UNKNOWN [Stylonychia lemnae]|eukprot:CDW75508.1 UNKNOWN [Stylonychia lemnae]
MINTEILIHGLVLTNALQERFKSQLRLINQKLNNSNTAEEMRFLLTPPQNQVTQNQEQKHFHSNLQMMHLENISTIKNYWRPASNFNPTFDQSLKNSRFYDFQKVALLGIFPQTQIGTIKLKFVIYNSNLLVQDLNFTEITSQDTTTDALFVPKYSQYRWINITNCYFQLRQMHFFVDDGSNLKIENSFIDIIQQSRIVQYAAKADCSYHQNIGIGNNLIFHNNTFKDFEWLDYGVSIIVEYQNLNCQIQPITHLKIDNNKIANYEKQRLSYIFFTLNLGSDGLQNLFVDFQNNTFKNILNLNDENIAVLLQLSSSKYVSWH